MRDLQAFVRRIEGGRSLARQGVGDVPDVPDIPDVQDVSDTRDAARAGLDVGTWRAVRDGAIDVAALCALHRAASANHGVARRARPDGTWIVGPASPGKLRTKPQAVRLRDHVEPAWAPGALHGGLARLLRDAAAGLAADPVTHAARLVWALSRAQPFIAHNERVALMLIASRLRREGLPGLAVDDLERDPAFLAALIAATADDHSALARTLTAAIWAAAVGWAEWLGAPEPPSGGPSGEIAPSRWTLRHEHLALDAARRAARRVPAAELDDLVAHAAAHVAPAITARLGAELGPAERSVPSDHAERLAVALASAARGRRLCPHEPMLVVRWTVAGGLGVEVSLVVGAAGRGVSGASSLHLAIAPRDAIGAHVAPALLVIADEAAAARAARFDAWLGPAIAAVIDRGPLRL